MSKLIIRPMTKSDAGRVASIEQSVFSDPWSKDYLEDLAASGFHTVLVCEGEAGSIIGYLVGSHVAGEGEVLRVATDKAYRRMGAGSALMKQFLNERSSRGDEVVFLEVRASNAPAISVYEASGFKEYSRRPSYYKAPTEDAVLMSLNLPRKD